LNKGPSFCSNWQPSIVLLWSEAGSAAVTLSRSYNLQLRLCIARAIWREAKADIQNFPQSGPPQFTAAQMQAQVSRRFGLFTAFTGLGYAAEGTGSSPSFDSAQAAQAMGIPDFVLKNVTLAEAGCFASRCHRRYGTGINGSSIPDSFYAMAAMGLAYE
jgi:hypothetical protein